MINGEIQIKPRYNEVDQMGYVYHANYVSYCHVARTELMRKYGLEDQLVEGENLMMPVIEMNLKYKSPAHYDDTLTIKTQTTKQAKIRLFFTFEIFHKSTLICKAESTIVFVDKETRKPMQIPKWVLDKLNQQ